MKQMESKNGMILYSGITNLLGGLSKQKARKLERDLFEMVEGEMESGGITEKEADILSKYIFKEVE